jgi:nicotinate-nucleotide adenylyltransferase
MGGSFNPPHAGHQIAAEAAMKRLGLDQVWWLITPGNPLKSQNGLSSLGGRVELVRPFARGPRMKITTFERELGTGYTAATLAFLKRRHPGVRFVWIMGADNLSQFHQWERWREIARLMPMAVYVRPGSTRLAPVSPAAVALALYRVDERDAPLLAAMRPPAWVYLHGLMSSLSSSRIRLERQRKSKVL